MRCNKRARILFTALRDEHRDGALWSKLVSIFFKRAKEGLKPDVKMFAGLECHSERTLDALTHGQYSVATVCPSGQLKIQEDLAY